MASGIPDEINPFRAPTAAIGAPALGGAIAAAEVTRRAYLSHEASVKSLGLLNYLLAGCAASGPIVLANRALGVIDLGNSTDTGPSSQTLSAIAAGLMLLAVVIYGGMGYGLHNLQPWARWVTIVLMGLSLLSVALQLVAALVMNPGGGLVALLLSIVPLIIIIHILYLMLSASGAMVFSREYREVVRQTPHINCKTSPLLKAALMVFAVFIVAVSAIVLFGGVRC